MRWSWQIEPKGHKDAIIENVASAGRETKFSITKPFGGGFGRNADCTADLLIGFTTD
jgi:hypothetical protein